MLANNYPKTIHMPFTGNKMERNHRYFPDHVQFQVTLDHFALLLYSNPQMASSLSNWND
jgi:hypothetical protein